MSKIRRLQPGERSSRHVERPASITEHTVTTGAGSGYRIAVEHFEYAATQFEFYIPKLIWHHPAVKLFIQRLDSIDPGATKFGDLDGIWKGKGEKTVVYRKIIDNSQLTPANIRAAVRREHGVLMGQLSKHKKYAQDAVMFTDSQIVVTMSKNLRKL